MSVIPQKNSKEKVRKRIMSLHRKLPQKDMPVGQIKPPFKNAQSD